MTPIPAPKARLFAAGLSIALCVLLLQWASAFWLGNRIPFLFAMPALAFTAFTLGRGPAILVLVAGAVNPVAAHLASGGPLEGAAQDALALLAYLLVGGLVVYFAARLGATMSRGALAEERLQLAQEDANLGVYELDFQTGQAFVSPGLCRLLEQPVQQGPMPLEMWLGMLPSATVAETRRFLQEKVNAGDLRYEREQRIQLPSGRVEWLLARVRLTVAPSGELLSARGATINISERKKADELLQSTQAVLRQQLDDVQRLQEFSQSLVSTGSNLDDALNRLIRLLCDFHGSARGFIVVNGVDGGTATIAAQSGLDSSEVLRVADVLETFPPSGSWKSRVLADDLSTASSEESERQLAAACEAPAAHATGLRKGSGKMLGTILVLFEQATRADERMIRLSDICAATAAALIERERALKAAAINEQRFSVALDSSAVPFTILTPVRDAADRIVDFRWTYANPAAADAIRLPIETLIGRRVEELMPGSWDEVRGLLPRYVTCVEQGVPCDFEVPTRNFAGWFYVIASPLQGSVAVWFTDITARKRQQQDLQIADRRKDEFLATLAHELRNPLAPIRHSVMIARSLACDESQRTRSLDVIDRQVRRMALLLDDLLDLSRISRGAIELRKAPVFLSEVVESSLETSAPVIQGKQHQLVVDLPPTPLHLNVDALRLSQTLSNLLTNAAKYTDGGGRIELRARLEGDELVLRVIDNGIGLAPQQLTQVFEMYSQAPDAVDKSQGGLGIGLALARGLVQLHGGSLDAFSQGPGTGSEFTVRLPARDNVLGFLPRLPAVPSQSPADAEGSLRMLVADDNWDAAESLAGVLRLAGHLVQVAHDGREALEAFDRSGFDVALLDVGMPRMNGYQAASAIRALPSGRQVILIALTGWGQEQDKTSALHAGFDHHTTKPADPAALLALIASTRAARGVQLV